jgi:uncharacterized protein (DUF58 family)
MTSGKRKQEPGKAKEIDRIRPTAYGWITLFLAFWVVLAAVVTGNNFLFIIFGMTVGIILISDRLARRNIRSFSFSGSFAEEMFAEIPFTVRYVGRTENKRWGSLTIKLREALPLQFSEGGVDFLRVLPGKPAISSGVCTVGSRGDKVVGVGLISSSFPFGLATYSRRCGPEQSILVFPKIEPVDSKAPFSAQRIGTGRERVDPLGTVPYYFRDYVPGDQYKRIDWKKSARSGTLVTRILADEGASEVTIRLPRNASEQAISGAASLVVHLGRLGTPVALKGPGISVEAGLGVEFTRRLLTILARWDSAAEPGAETDDTSRATVEVDQSGEFRVRGPGGA